MENKGAFSTGLGQPKGRVAHTSHSHYYDGGIGSVERPAPAFALPARHKEAASNRRVVRIVRPGGAPAVRSARTDDLRRESVRDRMRGNR